MATKLHSWTLNWDGFVHFIGCSLGKVFMKASREDITGKCGLASRKEISKLLREKGMIHEHA